MNADINDWIQEEFHVDSNDEQMELSDTESDDLYRIMVMNKTKLKWTIYNNMYNFK